MSPCMSKGQLISKCLFGVFNFFQKTNEKQVDLRHHSSKVEFVRSFFGRNVVLKKSFRLCLTFIRFNFNDLDVHPNELKKAGNSSSSQLQKTAVHSALH